MFSGRKDGNTVQVDCGESCYDNVNVLNTTLSSTSKVVKVAAII